jgi:hypothetical protein
MKKIILILILAAFAGSTLMQTEVQAAPAGSVLAVKNLKKSHKNHKKHHHKKKSKKS